MSKTLAIGATAAAVLLGPGPFGAPSTAAAQSSEVPARRGWLGVAMEPGGSGPGVLVSRIIHGSPAERCGLREGDRIVRVDGQLVHRSEDVTRIVGGHAVGDSLEVGLLRDGASPPRRVVLSAVPSESELLAMDLVGRPAPVWRGLEPVRGAFPASLAALKGRVVLLDFWATWCPPCRLTIPALGALQSRYGAQGLSVLGISTEEAEEVAAFAEHAIPYPVAVDPQGRTTRSHGVLSLPTVVVIDKRGVVRYVVVGYDPSEDGRLEASVRALIAESAGN